MAFVYMNEAIRENYGDQCVTCGEVVEDGFPVYITQDNRPEHARCCWARLEEPKGEDREDSAE